MPELPEVETMVRGLRPVLEGGSIRALKVLDGSMIEHAAVDQLQRSARGASVVSVGRRGKWVVITLGGTRGIIVIQPRMTGAFYRVDPPEPRHIRLILKVHNQGGDQVVFFCDQRRLGRIAWYPDAGEAERAFERSLGPDALVISVIELADRLARTHRSIKPALMDQKVLAGLGNIYADEVAFRAGIHPERKASGLAREEVERIHLAIVEVLNEAIRAEGSSFDAGYRNVMGREGGFLASNHVYGRAGQPCRRCGESIVRAKIAGLIGRSTHWCPTCQPAPGPEVPEARRGRRGSTGRSGPDRVW